MAMDYSKMGLVLEGGGMRGVFTCGVLDYRVSLCCRRFGWCMQRSVLFVAPAGQGTLQQHRDAG